MRGTSSSPQTSRAIQSTARLLANCEPDFQPTALCVRKSTSITSQLRARRRSTARTSLSLYVDRSLPLSLSIALFLSLCRSLSPSLLLAGICAAGPDRRARCHSLALSLSRAVSFSLFKTLCPGEMNAFIVRPSAMGWSNSDCPDLLSLPLSPPLPLSISHTQSLYWEMVTGNPAKNIR
jgi:hypothetical protein